MDITVFDYGSMVSAIQACKRAASRSDWAAKSETVVPGSVSLAR
jgi:hypothetical protein